MQSDCLTSKRRVPWEEVPILSECPFLLGGGSRASTVSRLRAKKKTLGRFSGFSPESPGQNLALTVSCVQCLAHCASSRARQHHAQLCILAQDSPISGHPIIIINPRGAGQTTNHKPQTLNPKPQISNLRPQTTHPMVGRRGPPPPPDKQIWT